MGTGSTTPWKPYNTKTIVYNNAVDDWRDSGNRKCTEGACVSSPGYSLKSPALNKPWIKRWEKCKKGEPIPCSNKWDDLSYWTEEFNSKTGNWEPTGVNKNDPGCKSGPLGKFNTLHYGTCQEGKPDWKQAGNWPKVHTMLRDVGNFDFRPRDYGSKKLIGAGKPGVHFLRNNDIGAYESGGVHYNIPGRVEMSASSPVPPNGAFNVQTSTDLIFLRGFDAKMHRILIDDSFCNVATAPIGSGQIELESPNNIFTPTNNLQENGRYYWRVDTVKLDNTLVKGAVWCFDVEADASNIPELSTPWNLRTNKSDCAQMDIDRDCIGSTPTRSPSVCQDDVTFRYNGEAEKSCIWVSQRPTNRCKKTDPLSGKTVRGACPNTCNVCSGTNVPTPGPTSKTECQDDDNFRYQNDPIKTCDWVSEKPNNRCRKSDPNDGKTVKEACPVTCNACDGSIIPTQTPIANTNIPTGDPTLMPSLSCQDDDNFRYQNDPIKSCDWVSQKPNNRCRKSDPNDEKSVEEACPVTCGSC